MCLLWADLFNAHYVVLGGAVASVEGSIGRRMGYEMADFEGNVLIGGAIFNLVELLVVYEQIISQHNIDVQKVICMMRIDQQSTEQQTPHHLSIGLDVLGIQHMNHNLPGVQRCWV